MGLKKTLKIADRTQVKAPTFKEKQDDVLLNVDRVIRHDSPLMKQAETAGFQMANRRGLLSSTMAVGAAQDEVLKKAVEIGGQEAQQRFQKNLSRQGFTQERAINRETIRGDFVRQDRDQDFVGGENRKDRRLTKDESRMDRNLTRSEAGKDRKLTTTESRRDRQFTRGENQKAKQFDRTERKLDRGMQRDLANWNLDASARQEAATMLAGFMGTYEQSLNAINTNKDLNKEQRTAQTTALMTRRTKFVNMTRALFDVDVSW